MRKQFLALVLALSLLPHLVFAQTSAAWCGYALIQGIPGIGSYLQILSLIAPDASGQADPDQRFQSRLSLDGNQAIVEACWKVFPTRSVIVNLLALGGLDNQIADGLLEYSLFAPDGSHEDSAASVRAYLALHRDEWEPPCSDPVC